MKSSSWRPQFVAAGVVVAGVLMVIGHLDLTAWLIGWAPTIAVLRWVTRSDRPDGRGGEQPEGPARRT